MSYQSDWDNGLLNRNYFVLQELVNSGEFDRILSVDFLPFSAKKIAKVLVEQAPFRRNTKTVFSALTARVDRVSERLFHMTAISDRYLKAAFEELGLKEDDIVMWNYSPFNAPVMKRFPRAQHVFEAVDNWAEHSVYANRAGELHAAYDEIKKSADVIFTVSQPLAETLGEKATCIPNGVDAAHFAKVQMPSGGHAIGYHGNIQSRFDFDLLEHIATARPEYTFAMHGWVWDEVASYARDITARCKNVTFPGQFDYADLPQIMNEWSAAIIPHKNTEFTRSMNPMKVYEYLAAGKPVVSTPIDGLDDVSEHVTVAESADAFVTALDVALKLNSTTAQTARRASVAKYTWASRVQEMLSHL